MESKPTCFHLPIQGGQKRRIFLCATTQHEARQVLEEDWRWEPVRRFQGPNLKNIQLRRQTPAYNRGHKKHPWMNDPTFSMKETRQLLLKKQLEKKSKKTADSSDGAKDDVWRSRNDSKHLWRMCKQRHSRCLTFSGSKINILHRQRTNFWWFKHNQTDLKKI